jgi:hypothetical protein
MMDELNITAILLCAFHLSLASRTQIASWMKSGTKEMVVKTQAMTAI